MTARTFRMLVIVVVASACSGKDDAPAKPKAPAKPATKAPPPAPPPPTAMTAQSCLGLTAAILELPVDATPYKEREVAQNEETRVVETVAAEALALRGHPGAVCMASVKRDSFPCTKKDPACTDAEGLESTTNYVVAVVTDGKVSDRRTSTREFSEGTSEGDLSWKVIGLGKTHDGLLLMSANEAGDASTVHTTWLTVAEGKFVEHMSYKTGIEDGDFAGKVEHKVLAAEVAGYATIELSVTRDEAEGPSTDTCAWDSESGLYKCAQDLIEGM